MNLGLNVKDYKIWAFWTLWYRYHSVWYRYHTHSVWWYRYHLYRYLYRLGSVWWYRYHPVSVPVPLRGFAQNCFFLPSLVPIIFIPLLHSIIPQESTWNSSKTTPQHLNWWFGTSYNQTLGENLMNSTQGPPIPYKTI